MNVKILIVLLFVISSCSPKIHYLGKKYKPTTNVDIFFNVDDIDRPFETIGMIRNSGKNYEINDPDNIFAAMLNKAKEVGADAIIFHGMYKEVPRGEIRDSFGNRNTDSNFSISSSSLQFTKIYEGSLIKFR